MMLKFIKQICTIVFMIQLVLTNSYNNNEPYAKNLLAQIQNPNKILLNGEITKISIASTINEIMLTIDKKLDNNIFIVIDSVGGDLIEGFRLIDFMDRTRITNLIRYECICIQAISTAFYIYQLCDYRYVVKNSLMLIHEPKLTITGTFDFVSNYLSKGFDSDLKTYNQLIDKICTKNKIDKKYFLHMIKNKDWILSETNEIINNNFTNQLI
jgi:ATP-dependent protease ClpP protease subunit